MIQAPNVPLWQVLHVLSLTGVPEDERGELMRAEGIEPAAWIDDGAESIPSAALRTIWERAWSIADRPDLPLVAATQMATERLQVADFIALTAPDVAAVLDAHVRFAPLWDRGTVLRTQRSPRGLMLIRPVAPRARWGDRLLAVRSLTTILGCTRRVTGAPLVPLQVTLPMPAPPDPRPYVEFFGVTPEFDAADAAFLLSREDAAVAPGRAHPRMHAYFIKELDAAFSTRHGGGELGDGSKLIAEVAALIAARLDQPLLAGELARQLGLSERSLQRRLADADTSLSTIRDLVRVDTARHKLAKTSFSIAEIGYSLGFEEPASFTRFFKRICGRTPTQYRADPTG